MTNGLIVSTNKKAALKSPSYVNKEAHRKFRNIFTTCLQKAIENYYSELIDIRKQNRKALAR